MEAALLADILAAIKNGGPQRAWTMNSDLLATFTVTKPVAIGLGVAALVVLYLGFKAVKFMMKLLLLLTALVAIGLAAWWYFAAHHA